MTSAILLFGEHSPLLEVIHKGLKPYTNFSVHKEENIFKTELLLSEKTFDILIFVSATEELRNIHCEESMHPAKPNIFHQQLWIFEKLFTHFHKFKMVIFIENSDIFGQEEETPPVPDYQHTSDFSKYIMFQRIKQCPHVYHLRICQVFHFYEHPECFIATCFRNHLQNKILTIHKNKMVDYMYEEDFITVLKYYIDHHSTPFFSTTTNQKPTPTTLPKILNVGYAEKHRLSEIATIIMENKPNIEIKIPYPTKHHTKDTHLLSSIGISIGNMHEAISKYREMNSSTIEI